MPAKTKSKSEDPRAKVAQEMGFDTVVDAVEHMRGSIKETLDQTREAVQEALKVIRDVNPNHLKPVAGAAVFDRTTPEELAQTAPAEDQQEPEGLRGFGAEEVEAEWKRAMEAVQNAVLETDRELTTRNATPETEARRLERSAREAVDSMTRHMTELSQAAMPAS